jgi:hypothetical protein
MRHAQHYATSQEEPLNPYWRGFIAGGLFTVCIVLIVTLGLLYVSLMGIVG